MRLRFYILKGGLPLEKTIFQQSYSVQSSGQMHKNTLIGVSGVFVFNFWCIIA